MAHWNPWEKIDKKSFLKMLDEVRRKVEFYDKYQYGFRYLIPNKVHGKILALHGLIGRCDNFYAYYEEAVAVYKALQILDKPEVKESSATQARAFGNLFLALSKMVLRIPNPLISQYGYALQAFGNNFEKIVNDFLPAGFNDPVYARIWANANDTRF